MSSYMQTHIIIHSTFDSDWTDNGLLFKKTCKACTVERFVMDQMPTCRVPRYKLEKSEVFKTLNGLIDTISMLEWQRKMEGYRQLYHYLYECYDFKNRT